MTADDESDLVGQARQIIDANSYIVLATANGDGRPWASPVWFAHDGYRDFYWISRPGARHSGNLTGRADVGAVFFDSTVAPLKGKAVYVEATASEVPEAELEHGVETYSARSQAQGIEPLGVEDVTGSGQFRLYRARATAHYVLSSRDERIPVDPT
jgi:nitroimidazol reductase NimA-like FMN-containing flavoprotein (pyridoxamine 5'-phosphate oxidase superfamily)